MFRSTHLPSALVVLTISSLQAGTRIGIYHWGGEGTKSMAEGVERIASLGGTVARLAYSPSYYTDYNTGAGCYPNFSLTALAHEPDVRRALNDSRMRVLILTAYDGATFGDCQSHKYLNPRFYTAANVYALKSEYSDFVLHLFRAYTGTGRRFILSHWEGDNALYCGEAYSYVVNVEFRKACDANYAFYYDGNAGVEQSLEGMRLWLQTRHEGITDGIARARSAGLFGIEVLHAPEISVTRLLEEHGFRSVLRDILPAIRPDYVSYSSYESINCEDPAATLAADIKTIRTLSGASAVIIGEAGYSRRQWGNDSVKHLHATIRSAFDSGVMYFIYWNLHDQGEFADFGVYDTANLLTPIGRLIEQTLRSEQRLSQGHSCWRLRSLDDGPSETI